MYPEISEPPQIVDAEVSALYPLNCGSGINLRAIVITKESGDDSWVAKLYSRDWDGEELDVVFVEESSDGKNQITTSVKHQLREHDVVTLGNLSPGGGEIEVLRIIDEYTFVVDSSFTHILTTDDGVTIQLVMSTARKEHYLVKSLSSTANVARHDGDLPYRNLDAPDNTGQLRKIYITFDTEGEYTVTFRMTAHDAY